MSNTLNTPMSTGEQYLGAIVGQTGVTAPDHPTSRMEEYLAYMLTNGTAREAEIRQMIEALKDGMKYKGSVATVADLPTAASSNKGWLYTILANGHEYVSDGTQWVDISADVADKEDKSNKVTTWQATTDNTHYPSEKLVKDSLENKVDKVDGKGLSKNDYTDEDKLKVANAITQHQDISGKEDKANKVTSFQTTPDDTHYPSEKLVKDSLDAKSAVSVSATGTATDEVEYITINGVEKKLKAGVADAIRYSQQTLTEAQKIQALKNLDGVRIVPLTDGSETLAQITTRLSTINASGEHVFFDVAALNYPLYLCTIAIKYDGSTPKSYRLNDLVSGSMSMGPYEATKTLSSILSEAVNAYYSLVVTCTASDGATVTGQTVTVRKGQTSSSPVYQTKSYNGQPVTFVLPDGFDYFVEVSNTLAQHFNPTTSSGRMAADAAVTLTYSSLSTISTFPDLKGAIDIGATSALTVGQEVSFTHATEGTLTYEIVHIDVPNEKVYLLQTTTLNGQKQFDAPEALYKPTSTMAAGSYCFTHSNTVYYFTLTYDLPADGHLRATTTQFWTYSSASNTTAIESGAVSTTVIEGATSIGTTASMTLNHMDRVNYGSNDYGESAIAQWLAASSTGWWTPKSIFDRPPAYVGETGFLAGVPADVLNSIDNATISVGTNSTYVAPGSTHEKGQPYTMQAKFYLATQKELFGVTDMPDATFQFTKFINGGNDSRIRRYNGTARYWWLRSPHSVANNVRTVNASGASNLLNAYGTFGVVPACQMSRSQ